MRRGQASLEQLIITGIALFIVAMIFYFSINYARDSARIAQGKDAVEKLAKSADYVHALGEGAKSKVNLYIPEGVEFVNASGGRIQMRISLSSGETDVFANTQAGLVGEIPVMSGEKEVSVATTANGNVMFGEDYISCTPTSIVKSFVQGASGSDSVVIRNIGDFIISNVFANLSGEAVGLVSVVGSSYSSTIGVGNSTSAALGFSIPAGQAVGTYGATLLVTASNFSECSTHITVSVSSSSGPDVQGPIVTSVSHYPASPNNASAIVINASATEVGVGNSTISLCQLAIDASGVWNDMNGAYGQTTVSVTYALGALATGAHNVSVRCVDSAGNIGNASSDAFYVSAGGETQGPIVTFIASYPANATAITSVVVNATGSDASTGGSNISLCELQLDAGAYNAMNASGGAYNTSVVRNVTYTVGLLGAGTHNVSVRCTDSFGNVGNASAYSFNVAYVDTQGPIVTFIASFPVNATTSNNVVVNATASDNSTGGSNISICQLRLDGGNFSSMNASGSAYNTSVTQNATYSLGLLSSGLHNVSVRCNDSAGNMGSASNYSFNITFVDTVGPIVSLITSTPSNAHTNDSVRINATANDSTTGGSNITMCQLRLDAGTFNNMNVSSGAYNTSAVQNVNYVLGTLAAGTHNVSVRCNDSAGNMGGVYNSSFNVTTADATGPVVHSISIVPSNATTLTPITVYAIGNDTTTGGSGISMCLIQLDGGAFGNMNATDGAYGSVAENVTYALGLLGKNGHTIGIKCNDTAGNMGGVYNLTFNVTKGFTKQILFITTAAAPSTPENRWLTWIGAHASGLGFDFSSYDQVQISDVTGGAANVSDYRIVAMAEAPQNNAAYYAILNSYRTGTNEIVLLGQALQYGIGNLGGGAGTNGSQNTNVFIPRASHYITSGYTIGTSYTIQTANNVQYWQSAYAGATSLASTATSTNRYLWDGAGVVAFGASRPDAFNANGNIFATRSFDWALNNSN